jgi:hypothetical protein
MYERQIDQLFDFSYRSQDDTKILFTIKDLLEKRIDTIEKKYDSHLIFQLNAQSNNQSNNQSNTQSNNQLTELKGCIQNYYYLEVENKKRMENIECYQFQLFICQIFIIGYLIYIRFV